MLIAFDIDGVLRDVAGSYRLALADTVEHFTQGAWRPTPVEIDTLKGEGLWNNDWEASQELIYRYFESQGVDRPQVSQGRVNQGLANPENGEALGLTYESIVAFFQSRYRGEQVNGSWTGYISQEPLLVDRAYFEALTSAGIRWGFFSGATTVSARFVLQGRVGLDVLDLVAMEDAPGKPNPTGLFQLMTQLEIAADLPVVYVGDTVADMQTIVRARTQDSGRLFWAIGSLPPHVVTGDREVCERYEKQLQQAGADAIVASVREITPQFLQDLIAKV